MPCLRNDFLELGRDGLVLDRHETRQQLDERHLAAKSAEDRRELDADRTAAHDRDRLRHLAQMNGFVARDDPRLVDRDARARCCGADPVATMISRARSVCASPSKTSTSPPPVSRAVPLIQSILFFLNRYSIPLVRPPTILSLRAWTCRHVDADRRRRQSSHPTRWRAARSSARARARAAPWSGCSPPADRSRRAPSASRRRRPSRPSWAPRIAAT